jgi:hypothetical protein
MQHPMLAAEGHSRCRIEIRSSGGWDGLPLEKYARKFANVADASVFPHHPQRLADASSISVATVLTIPPKSGNNDASIGCSAPKRACGQSEVFGARNSYGGRRTSIAAAQSKANVRRAAQIS